jgi:RNA polymerase sigma-70 factor (sigma-E family)
VADRGIDFRDFVAGRSPALVRTAFLLTGDWQRAEDLLQTALLRCFGRWSSLTDPEAYVKRTMVTTVTGWRRRRWAGEVPTASVPDRAAAGDPEGEAEARLDLLRSLAKLGPRQRAVIVLRFYEDLTEADIAALLGVSTGTVKSQLSRALTRLRTSPRLRGIVEEASS